MVQFIDSPLRALAAGGQFRRTITSPRSVNRLKSCNTQFWAPIWGILVLLIGSICARLVLKVVRRSQKMSACGHTLHSYAPTFLFLSSKTAKNCFHDFVSRASITTTNRLKKKLYYARKVVVGHYYKCILDFLPWINYLYSTMRPECKVRENRWCEYSLKISNLFSLLLIR